MELEERAVRCEQVRIENSKQNIENKITAVVRFAEAMTVIDAEWKNDHQLVLQTQEVLKHVFFRAYPDACAPPPLALGDGRAAPASISIAQVALEMGVLLEESDAIRVGTLLGILYKEKYGTPPPQHDQLVDGAVRAVDRYTARDADLVEAAIRALVKR